MSTHPADRAARVARRGLVAVLGVGLVASIALPTSAGAAGGPSVAAPVQAVPPVTTPAGPGAPVPPPGPAPELAVGLDQVAISSPEYDAAVEHQQLLFDQRQAATRRRFDALTQLKQLHARDEDLTAQLADAGSRKRLATKRLAVIRRLLRDLAVSNYINGRATADASPDLGLDVQRHNELGKQALMVSIVNSDKIRKLRLTKAALDKATTQITIATAVRKGVRAKIAENELRRDEAQASELRLGGELITAVQAVADTRHLAMVDGADFPLVVLDAYVKAADLLSVVKPECGIQWWAMAGIGRTESRHGTFGGAEVRVDGTLTKPILGIPLNGTNNTAVVSGAGGFDRAQGPMQFISSTWARWGADGTGDGVKDIQNLYDAAAGAAAYLCAGGPMVTDADLTRGYLSYNQSMPYAVQVLGQAHGYQESIEMAPRPPADELAAELAPLLTPPGTTPTP